MDFKSCVNASAANVSWSVTLCAQGTFAAERRQIEAAGHG